MVTEMAVTYTFKVEGAKPSEKHVCRNSSTEINEAVDWVLLVLITWEAK